MGIFLLWLMLVQFLYMIGSVVYVNIFGEPAVWATWLFVFCALTWILELFEIFRILDAEEHAEWRAKHFPPEPQSDRPKGDFQISNNGVWWG